MTPSWHIGIVGYGNVGTHLTHVLGRGADIRITVYRRDTKPIPTSIPNTRFTRHMEDLSGTDLIIVSVNDDSIITVIQQLKTYAGNAVVCHTAGSVSSEVMLPHFDRYGVLYPLQTFSRDKELDYEAIPVFVTGSDRETVEIIRQVASRISPIVYEINDEQRMSLHIAAVFTCNYTNAFYSIGHRLCADHGLDFKYLLPLIEETARKIRYIPPAEAQTGPAIRGDEETLLKHENFLAKYDPEIRKLYHQVALFINQKM